MTCLCLLADVAVQQGDFQRAQAVLDQTSVLVEKQANHSIVIQTQRSMAGALFARQDFAAARTVSQHMLDLCQRIGNQEGAADAHARLGATNARLFHIPAARQHYAEAERLYRLLDKRQGQAAVLVNTGPLVHAPGSLRRRHRRFPAGGTTLSEIGRSTRPGGVCLEQRHGGLLSGRLCHGPIGRQPRIGIGAGDAQPGDGSERAGQSRRGRTRTRRVGSRHPAHAARAGDSSQPGPTGRSGHRSMRSHRRLFADG